jgi:WD40 repeat protein
MLWRLESDTVLGDYFEIACAGKESQFRRDTNTLSPLALAPEGKRLLALRGDGQLLLFDALTGRRLWGVSDFPTRAQHTTAVQFAADGETFWFEALDRCDGRRFFGVRRADNGALSTQLSNPNDVISQGSSAALLDGGWEIRTSFPVGRAEAIVMRQSPSRPYQQLELGVVDLRSQKFRSTVYVEHDSRSDYGRVNFGLAVPSIGMSRDGRWMAAGGPAGTVRIWDLQSQKLMHVLKHRFPTEHDEVRQLLFSPDGRRLYSLASRWRMWDVASGAETVVR